ncbi:type II secretion system protein [Moorella sulfitireducens]|uniref:type II secretion system protein n=1 Tax=Neomoorella sulfitireducens TaxID=2972948 RepID=UPI0021AC658C|nr:type II secretion system protein [Moorella sulfitireducens]
MRALYTAVNDTAGKEKPVSRQAVQGGHGFTLLEVVTVVAITSILATVTLPVVNRSLAWWQVQTAAWQLVSDIRAVQQMAVSGENYHRTILFDTVNNLYRVRKDAVIVKETKLPDGVTFASVAFPYSRLSFNLQGVPSASGDIVLKDRYGRFYYITVLPVTGRVKAGSTT